MTRRSVGIRLDVLGKAEVVAALKDAGGAGEAMARRINRAAPQASRGLKAIDVAARNVRSEMDAVANRSGLLGRSLAGMGPAGKAAAIGMGAVTVAAGALSVAVRQAVAEMTRIEQTAAITGDGIERFQELAAGAQTVGVEMNELGDILRDVRDRAGEFISGGTGPMADYFKQIAPLVGQTVEEFQELTGSEILQKFADGLAAANVSADQQVFYLEALSSEASRLAPLLADGGAGFQRLAEEAREAGRIYDEDVIRRAEEANQEFKAAIDAVSVQMKSAFVELVPAITPVVTAIGGIAASLTDAVAKALELFGILDKDRNSPIRQQIELKTTELVTVQQNIQRLREDGAYLRGNRAGQEFRATGSDPDAPATVPEIPFAQFAKRDALSKLDRQLEEAEYRETQIQLEIGELKKQLEDSERDPPPPPRRPPPPKEPGSDNLPVFDETGVGPSRSALPVFRGMTAEEANAKREQEQAARDATEALNEMTANGLTGVMRGLFELEFGLRNSRDLLNDWAMQLATDIPNLLAGQDATTAVGGVLQGALGGGLIGSALTGLGGLLGFSGGGSFYVGSGTSSAIPPQGGDDRLVRFRARVGERVSINRPDQVMRDGSSASDPPIILNNTVNVDARGATDPEAVRALVREGIQEAAPQIAKVVTGAATQAAVQAVDYQRRHTGR